MKNQKNATNKIVNISFQTQLFAIILLCFILFIVVEYVVVRASFRRQYINSEIKNTTSLSSSFCYSVDRAMNNGVSLSQIRDSYIAETSAIPLMISNSTGGYIIIDNEFNSYSKNNNIVNSVLEDLNRGVKFTKTEDAYSTYSGYYYNIDKGYLYCISSPNSMSENEFILSVFSLIRTESLLDIISSHYGYIILASIIVAVLIALFISKVFSEPIRKIEREMRKLNDNNYNKSNFDFKNKEMISLQKVLNEVKEDTKEKVESINSQKELLEKANNELIKESELRSVFIARLSHELKTPLMVIGASAEAMLDGIIDDEDSKKKEYNTILEEVDKTTSIIKDIITTYKSSGREMKLNITRFDLNQLVLEVTNSLTSISTNNEQNLEINLNAQVYMNADRELIKEVISNFITNALKYTKSGNKIEINILDQNKNYIFEVKNYGAHINKKNLDKIWLPFYRENENVDKTSTGMGLYIVKEILTNHKLKFNVTNFDEGVKAYIIINK